MTRHLLLALLATGCATSSAPGRLPTVDRLSRVIVNRLGEQASVGVRYCVSPAGEVVSAELAQPSSMALFDNAVMTDIARWRFEPQPDTVVQRTCQRATIVYRMPG